MEIEALFNKRMNICKNCPLYKETDIGPVCDDEKWINTDKRISRFPKIGYIRGCGCKLNFKAKNPASHCVIRLW